MPKKKDQDEERAARLDHLVEEYRVETAQTLVRVKRAHELAKANVKHAKALLSEIENMRKRGRK